MCSRRSFFGAFKIFVRYYLKHQDLLFNVTTPEHLDCPTRCPKNYKKSDAGFCKTTSGATACDVEREREKFRAEIEKVLDKEVKGWQAYGFEILLSNVYQIINLKDIESRKPLSISNLIRIYESEEIRATRIQNANR